MPLAGPRAVTTLTMSPACGSAIRTTLVAPATAAFRVAGPSASSRVIRTTLGGLWSPGPSAMVQVGPTAVANTGAPCAASMRTAL